ncbi:uncharacterized protein TrAFT101_008306 [Trichoderma asperellum]|uniref:Hydrophobin n=1 Tax=Trichoderma asperellum (strain ATCC 204424 / CBS 433.97 / NBRC 101777) TaxID=1042311 RepID=A0A2T3ZCS3_TRIA4|nr:hypothetical protein M441DRAFT_392456 [Trichoderma asperellum CBS 433.97]PTB42606.1 hypothetical protein M441DRAFT_392456 [Trichoderma asperellum CBS 433.97]UKZ93392.1 hypothetical protein TrAFT101_008306 [Trichoderma asperellum]
MHFTQLAPLAMFAIPALTNPVEPRAADVQCFQNLDTAWWKPPGSLQTPPTVTIQDICNAGGVGGCVSGYGRLCVLGSLSDCPSLIATVNYLQKFRGNRWEFPSVVECGNIALSVASN